MATNFQPSQRTDDYRSEEASSYGGYQLTDQAISTKLRNAASELVTTAASQYWAGNFKLSNLPFPIKATHGRTELQVGASIMMNTMPVFFNAASVTNDKVERMKLVIVQAISYLYVEHTFEKPIESMLGETVQAFGQDGSKIFMELTNAEPTTSHYLFEGPNKNYTFTGYLEVNVSPGILSTHVLPKGYRKVTFKDGHSIKFNHSDDNLYNLTYGVMGHQMIGKLEFKDEQNNIDAIINFGSDRYGP